MKSAFSFFALLLSTLTVIAQKDLKGDTCKIIVPSAITPNYDKSPGDLVIDHNCPLDSFHIWIFDRWGNVVFEAKVLEKDNSVNWDYSKLNEDVYVWKLECIMQGEKIKLLGHITLLK